jgi:hypothetical protein
VLSAKERDFVRAARGFGASDKYLLRRQMLYPAELRAQREDSLILKHLPQFQKSNLPFSTAWSEPLF